MSGVARVLVVCAPLALLVAPATRAQQPPSLTADIPAQPLAHALATFARQTGLQFVYVSDDVRSQKSQGVSTGLPADEALGRLLQGTGLRFEYLTAHSIRILPAAPSHETVVRAPAVEPFAEVIITGSHLNRPEAEAAAPLLIITKEEMATGGVQTSQDLLERFSTNQSFGGSNENLGAAGVKGFTAASLRGLGSQRTLVLLDGQRLAPYALSGGQGVDVSAIPLSALERIEVLKDGASAIYGTDAIGGVINFVLRPDYQGAEVNANYFATQRGGANNGRINATAGTGDLGGDGYNAFVSVDHFSQQSLVGSQRESTTTGYLPWLGLDQTSGYSFPANILQPAGFGSDERNPTIPYPGGATADSCITPVSFPTVVRPYQCRFDFAHVTDTIPGVNKTSVIARYTRQLGAQQFFGAVSYYTGTFTYRVAPEPVGINIGKTDMPLPPTSAFYPTAYVASLPGGDVSQPLELAYRTVELGRRVDRLTSELWRGVAGLRGSLEGWNYELVGSYTGNRQVDQLVNGYPWEPTFGPLLRSGVINPFGPNTDAVVRQMQATQFTGWIQDTRAADFGTAYRMTREIWGTSGGPVALALGIEGRRESLEQRISDAFASGDILGFTVPSAWMPAAHRTVWALFAEADVPFAPTLAANLALRSDHYSDFGTTTNPKIALRWLALPAVVIRAAYGQGFRVPTLADLYLSSVPGLTINSFDDPLRCSVTHSATDCAANFTSLSGGNPTLHPEKSQQWGAGLVVGPLRGLAASLDYFKIEVRDVIDTLQADEVFANYAFWAPTHVVRKAPDTQYPELPGPIDHVIENQINYGRLSTSGIDADIRFAAPQMPIGRIAIGLNGTYTLDYGRTGISTSLYPADVGTRGPSGAIARWRHSLTFDWFDGRWGATVTQTFQDGYREVDLLSCDQNLNCPGTRRVSPYSLWGLQGRYEGIRNVTASAGIRNVLDSPPPVTNQTQAGQTGTDPTYADPRGRTYYLAVRYAVR